jgi:hypothetical protein
VAYTAAKLLHASGPGERRNHDRAYARGDLSKFILGLLQSLTNRVTDGVVFLSPAPI